jgi:nicotinate-nucleotide pyrophosphorylase (carboxylating)
MFDPNHPEIRDLVRAALAEDIGTGDITTNTCVDTEAQSSGVFVARQAMVVAGTELLPLIYEEAGDVDTVALLASSGARAEPGDRLAIVSGPTRRLLTCERVCLNFLQRLSGVATLAAHYTAAVAHTNCRILDTRKTTPGWRRLEKMATAAGGVVNHRMGLYDGVLIKNNHIRAAGGVRAALARLYGEPIEIEVRTLAELEEAIEGGAQHLLLDNLTPAQAHEWIARIAGRAVVELSGGINLDTVAAYAETGADFISCGAITHSAAAVDINFRLLD